MIYLHTKFIVPFTYEETGCTQRGIKLAFKPSSPETLVYVPQVCAEGVPVFQTPRKDSALVKAMLSFAYSPT